jgi:LysM repeat protein
MCVSMEGRAQRSTCFRRANACRDPLVRIRRRPTLLLTFAFCAVTAMFAAVASADGTPLRTQGAAHGPQAEPASPHRTYTTRPGDTMWSVARRNGVPVASLASASGRPVDGPLPVGAELRLPPPSPPPGGNGRLPFSLQVPIHSPRGPAYLAPDAARAWEAMRQASLRELGVDLYPFGPESAYRSYGKQVEAWRVFKAGGPPAAPPGTSAHGLGKAVDLASPEMRKAVDRLGGRFGWAKTEAPSEWGHVNYVGG